MANRQSGNTVIQVVTSVIASVAILVTGLFFIWNANSTAGAAEQKANLLVWDLSGSAIGSVFGIIIGVSIYILN